MRLLLAGILIALVILCIEENPYARHRWEANTKALDAVPDACLDFRFRALKRGNDPQAVARCGVYAKEVHDLLKKCRGDANTESIRLANEAVATLDDYVLEQIKLQRNRPLPE